MIRRGVRLPTVNRQARQSQEGAMTIEVNTTSQDTSDATDRTVLLMVCLLALLGLAGLVSMTA